MYMVFSHVNTDWCHSASWEVCQMRTAGTDQVLLLTVVSSCKKLISAFFLRIMFTT